MWRDAVVWSGCDYRPIAAQCSGDGPGSPVGGAELDVGGYCGGVVGGVPPAPPPSAGSRPPVDGVGVAGVLGVDGAVVGGVELGAFS
jgi:hypothetical protein